MTTIAPKVKKILTIVEEIKAAIEKKGVTVPAAAVFGDIPALILQILTPDDSTPIITDTAGATSTYLTAPVYITDTAGAVQEEISDYYIESEE